MTKKLNDVYYKAADYIFSPKDVTKHPYYYEVEKEVIKINPKLDELGTINELLSQNTVIKSNGYSGFMGVYFRNPFTNEALVTFKAKDWIPNDTIDLCVLASGVLSW